jgi:hypothetical protein
MDVTLIRKQGITKSRGKAKAIIEIQLEERKTKRGTIWVFL